MQDGNIKRSSQINHLNSKGFTLYKANGDGLKPIKEVYKSGRKYLLNQNQLRVSLKRGLYPKEENSLADTCLKLV